MVNAATFVSVVVFSTLLIVSADTGRFSFATLLDFNTRDRTGQVEGIDDCRRNPCPDNAVCRKVIDDYLCRCSEGYIGDPSTDCTRVSVDVRCQENDDCTENAECTGGRCQCTSGFTHFAGECVSRCYLKDLQHWEHISYETPSMISSGDRLNVKCEDGYSPIKEQPLCVNGTWSQNDRPLCIESYCVVPFTKHAKVYLEVKAAHFPKRGRVIKAQIPSGRSVSSRTVVWLSCEEPYNIFGESQRKKEVWCFKGTWSMDLACVKTICSDPGSIFNGNAEPVGQSNGKFIEGSSVKYSCAVQHYLKGEKSISCTENGTWSAPKPVCIRACSDLPAPTGGFVAYSLPTNVIIQPRSPMYLPSNPNERYSSLLVDPAAPIHSKVSMMVSVPEPVSLPPGLHWRETRAFYDCKPRFYELIGSRTRKCQERGEWSGRPPICMPVCGQSDSPRSPFIINGNATDIGQWPWQAGIARLVRGHFILECGASLLSEKWVVTAAHCVTHQRKTITFDPEVFRIYVGKYHREDSKDDEFVQVRKVKEIHIPSEYYPPIYDADIALLLLDSPVILNPRVQPICLPTEKTSRENLVEGKKGVVTGWGKDENGNHSETLRQAVLPVVSSTTCENSYRKFGHLMTVTENMFCAGYADGRTDFCHGDSGSPMVFTDFSSKDPKWVLEGIVSWGSSIGCGKENLYGGFTKVSKFLNWINEYL